MWSEVFWSYSDHQKGHYLIDSQIFLDFLLKKAIFFYNIAYNTYHNTCFSLKYFITLWLHLIYLAV